MLIIGGGLSGLSLAAQLAERGRAFTLIEARERLGGRILSEDVMGVRFDLGPAWFWPGQPRIAGLIERLALVRFDQYASGDLMFEDERGQVQRGQGFASMQGAYRLEGGLSALADGLARKLDPGCVQRARPVVALTRTDGGLVATLGGGEDIFARRAVLALPLRVAAKLDFSPVLPGRAVSAMEGTATWMAGHAKAVAVYDRAFWREAGLSGDAMSRAGPLVEIHDASPSGEGPSALFGFVGVPPEMRMDEDVLRSQICAQLGRLFGAEAGSPNELLLKDWAFDPFTSTQMDLQPLYAHPQYGLPSALAGLWDGRLIFAGTEVAPQFGGYLEGALEAAEAALALLLDERTVSHVD